MDYHTLFEKKERIIRIFERIPREVMAGFDKNFLSLRPNVLFNHFL